MASFRPKRELTLGLSCQVVGLQIAFGRPSQQSRLAGRVVRRTSWRTRNGEQDRRRRLPSSRRGAINKLFGSLRVQPGVLQEKVWKLVWAAPTFALFVHPCVSLGCVDSMERAKRSRTFSSHPVFYTTKLSIFEAAGRPAASRPQQRPSLLAAKHEALSQAAAQTQAPIIKTLNFTLASRSRSHTRARNTANGSPASGWRRKNATPWRSE